MGKLQTDGWDGDDPTSAQLKDFFEQIRRHRISKDKMRSFLLNGAVLKGEDAAREILGDDIIFPWKITAAWGLSYSEEQLNRLTDALPKEAILRWRKRNHFAMVACPPEPMSLLEIRALKPSLFDSTEKGIWYLDRDFARKDKTAAGWLTVCTDALSDFTPAKLAEQFRLFKVADHAPNAAELVWFVITYYERRDVRLFGRHCVKTASVDSRDASTVSISFDQNGIQVMVEQ